MSQVVKHNYYDPAPVNLRTRKDLERIKQEERIKQAALEAAARDALNQLAVTEELARYGAQARIKGTYDLADYAGHRATQLSHSIGQQAQGNSGLELVLRSFENTAAVTANLVIYQYGTGR